MATVSNVKDLVKTANAPQAANTNNASVMARAEAEVKASIFMAKTNPRDEAVAFAAVKKSIQRSRFAAACIYSFPRGGTNITGPSINFAREFARVWGNILYGQNIISDDGVQIIIEGWAWDLETNTKVSSQSSFKALVQRKVNTPDGGRVTQWVTPDERDKRELVNKHGAIATRNALLQLFPKDVIEDCMDAAFISIKANINEKPLNVRIADALNSFSGLGILQENLEAHLGKPRQKWTVDDVAVLITLFSGIKNGDIDKTEIAQKSLKAPVEDAPKTAKTKVDEVKQKIKDNAGANPGDIALQPIPANLKTDDEGRLINPETGKPI